MKKSITVSYEQAKGQHRYATAASFKRTAKSLRVRARNHQRTARGMERKPGMIFNAALEQAGADIYTGLAQDFDHEASVLRVMR